MFSNHDLMVFIPMPELMQRRSKLSTEANTLYSWCWHFYKNLQAQGKPFYLNWYQAAVVIHKSERTAKRVIPS